MGERIEEGDLCPDCGEGRMECFQPDDCSCHLSPPCHACTDRGMKCSACGWQLGDEVAADPAGVQHG